MEIQCHQGRKKTSNDLDRVGNRIPGNLQPVHSTIPVVHSTGAGTKDPCPRTPVEEKLRKEGVPRETIVEERIWGKSPDGIDSN